MDVLPFLSIYRCFWTHGTVLSVYGTWPVIFLCTRVHSTPCKYYSYKQSHVLNQPSLISISQENAENRRMTTVYRPASLLSLSLLQTPYQAQHHLALCSPS